MGYLLGFLKNLHRCNVSKLALVDDESVIDSKANICRFSKMLSSEIGAYTYLNPGSWLVHTRMGRFCSIGHDCYIGLPSHTLDKLSTSPIFTERFNGTGFSWVSEDLVEPYKKTVVGNDVWIGERVMVMGGVTIGNGAVIGAGAIVTKDVPPYSVVAGVPAKILRYRFSSEMIDALEKTGWWNLPDEKLKKIITLFQKSELDMKDIFTLTGGGVI